MTRLRSNGSAMSARSSFAAKTTVFVTTSGKRYHRAGCRALAKSAMAITLGLVGGRYKASGSCKFRGFDVTYCYS